MNSLENKVIIITGGSRGIGAAIAKRLSTERAKIVLIARTESDLKKVEGEIRKMTDVLTLSVDISSQNDVHEAIDKAIHRFGSIDILINNAGLFLKKSIEESTVEEFNSIISVDLKGMFLMTKAVLPFMKKQGRGDIVNISSNVGLSGASNQSLHSMCKFGIIGFSQSLQKELNPVGVRVMYICPGPTNTWNDPNPLKLLRPEDVANAVYCMVGENYGTIVNELVINAFQR